MSPGERRALVDRDDPDLPIAAQCRLLNVARSTLYYQPAPMDPDDLALMRRMSITMEADFCVEALREAIARWIEIDCLAMANGGRQDVGRDV